jgi:hypothetical protein
VPGVSLIDYHIFTVINTRLSCVGLCRYLGLDVDGTRSASGGLLCVSSKHFLGSGGRIRSW